MGATERTKADSVRLKEFASDKIGSGDQSHVGANCVPQSAFKLVGAATSSI